MKIAKNEAELKFRKDILLEEFQGPTMTADSLSKIAEFIPYLEKAYLDDDFINDSLANQINPKAITHALMQSFTSTSDTNTLTGAWKCLAQNILEFPEKDLKLRSLSLPGCAITDDTMKILSPALVKINSHFTVLAKPFTRQNMCKANGCLILVNMGRGTYYISI